MLWTQTSGGPNYSFHALKLSMALDLEMKMIFMPNSVV